MLYSYLSVMLQSAFIWEGWSPHTNDTFDTIAVCENKPVMFYALNIDGPQAQDWTTFWNRSSQNTGRSSFCDSYVYATAGICRHDFMERPIFTDINEHLAWDAAQKEARAKGIGKWICTIELTTSPTPVQHDDSKVIHREPLREL